MYILLNYENKMIVLKKLWNLWTVFSSAVIRELRTSILRPWGSLICDKRGREKTSFCDQQDLKKPQSTRKTMHVQKVKLHKSLMFGATENILLSESIVLMCFCLPPVLGNGTEWKYMHHGGRKELRLCLEQHMSKPVISRSWNSLIFWPFHSVLASKLKRLTSWNEKSEKYISECWNNLDRFSMYPFWNGNALDQVLRFGHVLFALQSDNICEITPRCLAPEEGLCASICRLVGQKLALVV